MADFHIEGVGGELKLCFQGHLVGRCCCVTVVGENGGDGGGIVGETRDDGLRAGVDVRSHDKGGVDVNAKRKLEQKQHPEGGQWLGLTVQ